MPASSQCSIQNSAGKYLQAGEAIRFGAPKGAEVGSKNQMMKALRVLKADDRVARLKPEVVAAPAEALEKAARAAAKAAKAPKAPRAKKVKDVAPAAAPEAEPAIS